MRRVERPSRNPGSAGVSLNGKQTGLPPFGLAVGFNRLRKAAQRRSGHLCHYLGHIRRVERSQCLSSDVA